MQADSALAKRVKAALTDRGHFDLQSTPIEVRTRDDTVRLAGSVETLRDKRRAEHIAGAVSGVKELQSDLRTQPVVAQTDEELARAARDVLEEDPNIDAAGMQVAAKDGVVTLRGLANTRMQRRVVVASLWWLPGAQDVRDELEVVYPEQDSDEELEDACHIMLAKDPLVDAEEVSVLARDGAVTLAGAVGSDVERSAAENTIWGLEGVKEVENRLVVVRGAFPPGVRETGV